MTMDTSSWNNTLLNLRTNSVKRTAPWFGRYPYCLRFYLPEASSLRSLNHDHIDRALDLRSSWGRRIITTNYGGSWRGSWVPLEITTSMKNNVHRACTFFQKETSDHKIMITGDWIYVYSTDLDLPGRLADLDYINRDRMLLSKIECVGEPGTIYLKHPRYLYRSYFRRKKQQSGQADRLRRFLTAQKELRISGSLSRWITDDHDTLHEHYFIDHDDQGILTMLALIDPGLIRKTLAVSTDK